MNDNLTVFVIELFLKELVKISSTNETLYIDKVYFNVTKIYSIYKTFKQFL